MTPVRNRRLALHAGLATGASLALPWRSARACEVITTHLRITHPWARASGPGEDSAMVCMKFDDVTLTDRLVLVETPVARSAEMGGQGAAPQVNFVIPQGQETYLAEAATFVRLTGLNLPLEVGRSYPLRLGFEKGGTYNAVLSVDYPRFK